MWYSVKLLPIAYQDLKNAKKWYDEQQESLGEEFKISFNNEIEYIRKYPEHNEQVLHDLRRSLLGRFPYAVFYLIEKNKGQITVLGVLHTSRNPEIIENRRGKVK